MIKQPVTRRKRNSFWHKPKRRNGLRYCKTEYENRRVIKREHLIDDEPVWTTETHYNIAGQVEWERDRYGLETHYIYDVRGLETEVRSQSIGSDGQTVWNIQRTVYDAAGRAIYSTSYTEGTPANKIYGSHTEYDKDGRAVKSEQLLGLVIELNANGNSYRKSEGTVIVFSSTVYNNAGWVLLSIDSYGLKTEYTYNEFGETTQVRRELANSGGWLISETVYDSQGRVVFSTDSHKEGSAEPIYGTKSLYDTQGRSIGSIRYKGCVVDVNQVTGISDVVKLGTKVYQTSTVYDSKGRVASSTDAYGNTTKYEYDNFDRQVKVTQANGLITETVYNDKGQVAKTIVKSGSEERTTEYKYDEFGNICETIQPDGTSIKAHYNNKGQKISETNQLGQTRYFEYDNNGQLMSVTLPAVNGKAPVYKYTYDAQGNQLTIEDPNGNITSFTYDINGNQTSRTLPDKSVETFEYDVKGRLVKQTSFEGVITTYQYDKYDRLESKTFTQNGKSEIWTYFYDSFGRVTEVHQGNRITYTKYNEQGQIEYIETPEGKISYEYDKYGQQASVQTDDDKPIYYTYDNFGRLATVSSDNETTYYEYDTFGNLVKEKMPNGITVIYKYDNMNRLIKLTNFIDKNNNGILDNGEGVSEFEYKLNSIGNKIHANETFWINGFENKNLIDWNYDNAGRLIQEVFNHYNDEFDQTSEWIYDLVGNRLKQTVNGIETVYSYDVNDRLLTEITNAKLTQYNYDHTQQTGKTVSENGTVVSETTFEYDAQGRMSVVRITTANGTETTYYEYDANGIRVSATHEANGVTTKTEYLNDSQNITGYSQVLKQTEFNAEGEIVKETSYVIGHQRISQTVKENGETKEYFFTFDGHGSTRVLLNASCAIAQLYSFDAYGNALGFNTGEALTEFLYSGEQFDSKIGQQYLRARYYDPATGRFNRLDPFFGNISDPQSLHKYTYTHNDPVNGIDPNGLFAALASTIVSTAINFGVQALTVTAISGAGGGAIGGFYYWTQGQSIFSGIYNGASIGASISAAYFMSAASRNWKIMADVLSSGIVSGIVSYILEVGTRYANNPNSQDMQTLFFNAQFKAFDSIANSMINVAFKESFDPDSTYRLVISFLETVLSSVANDLAKKPSPPPTATIIGNAGIALGMLYTQNVLIKGFRDKYAPDFDMDKIEDALEYFGQKVFIELIAKAVVGWDIKIIIETGKFIRNFNC